MADLLHHARQIEPLLRLHAEGQEAAGELAPAVVDALAAGGLFGIFTPACVGGSELTPQEAVRVVEQIAYGDASSAWVLFAVALCTGAAGAYLGDEAVQEIFGGGRVPITAGQGIPNGKAVLENGGYRLSGRWNYGSGVKHAAYVHTGAIVYEGDRPRLDAGGVPEVRIFYVPREQVRFLGNWDVMGLRGTGSIDYEIDGVHVDEAFSYHSRVMVPRRGSGLFRMGAIGLGSAGHTAFALGAGRRLLDELAAFARTKVGRPGMLGESESFLEQFGEAEAKLRAARAFVFDAWADAETTLLQNAPLATRQVTLIRLALNHATWTVSAISDFAYKAAGGVSLRSGAIQRYFRDVHGATQHITSSPTLLRECGRDLAGLAPGKSWAFLGLVDKVGG